MNEDEMTAYVVHHLTEGDDSKDLILDLCEKTSLSWPEAEALVKQIQEEKQGEIARKQFPLLFALALVIFLGGLGLLGYGLFTLAGPLLEGQAGSPLLVANYSYYLMKIVLESHGTVVYALVIGTGMILGSLIGMRDVWVKVLTK